MLVRYLLGLIREWSEQGVLAQLSSRSSHPFGLSDSRAEYINTRVKLLAMLFAILTPLWIPVDFIILDATQFQHMTMLRMVFSLCLLLLAGVPNKQVTFDQAQLRLVMLMVLPSLFHLATQLVLKGSPPHGPLIFYTFLPFLIIVMHCIFPLTLIEGAGLAVLSITLLSLDELISGNLFSFSGLAGLWLMCLIMGVAIWAQLSQLHMHLKLFDEATTDPLTGLLNRRTLMKQLAYIRRQLERHGRPVSLLMMDLDHFKQINDNYGHQVGDLVLRQFAKILTEQARSSDYLARFGGEEFLLVLPDTHPDEAVLLAERVLEACRSCVVTVDDYRQVQFSVSIGLGQLQAGQSEQATLSQVDGALYQAKQQGRDQVVRTG